LALLLISYSSPFVLLYFIKTQPLNMSVNTYIITY
jgi:hypothetical protein